MVATTLFPTVTSAAAPLPPVVPVTTSTSGIWVVGNLNPPLLPLPVPLCKIDGPLSSVSPDALITISPTVSLVVPPSYPVITPNPYWTNPPPPLSVPPTPAPPAPTSSVALTFDPILSAPTDQ